MPRIAAGTLAAHRAQVRQQVYDAFAELMAERSFDAITMAGLAERAGIGRTAIYHHFPDREAVLVGFATDVTHAYLRDLHTALDGIGDPAERLRTYVRHHLEAGDRFHMGMGPTIVGSLSESARLEIREHIVAVERVLRGILEVGRERGAFSYDDLDATLSLLHACLTPRHLPVAAVEAFVLRAVGAEVRPRGSADRS